MDLSVIYLLDLAWRRHYQPTGHLLLRFLLPWMVLHCIVIAFLALGAAILTAHDRALLGWIALIGKSTSAM